MGNYHHYEKHEGEENGFGRWLEGASGEEKEEGSEVEGGMLFEVGPVEIAEEEEVEAGDEGKEEGGEVRYLLDSMFIDWPVPFVFEHSSRYPWSHLL